MFTENLLLIDSEWFENYRAERETFVKEFSGDISALNIQELKAQLRKPILEMTDTGATINVNGPLSMEGPDIFDLLMGKAGVSYGEIIDAVNEAHASLPSESVVDIVANTPGGGVNGAEQTFRAIQAVTAERKTRLLVGSMVASAGVWALSAVTEISATGGSSMFGNMGCVVNVKDRTKLMANMGIVEKTIVNPESTDKVPDITTAKGEEIISNLLSDVYGVFESNFVEARAGKTSVDKIRGLNGAIVVAQKAIDAGLIDGFVDGVKAVGSDNLKSKLPAEIAGSTEETDAMNLQELLAQNPAIQKEIDALVQEGFEAGAAKEQEKIEARVTAAKPILSSKVYAGTKVAEIAAMVVTGEKSIETMDAVLAVLDLQDEGQKSDDAKAETKKIDDEGGTPPTDPAGDQKKAAQAEVDARVARLSPLQ